MKPRHYAAEIMKLPTKAERQKYLAEQVPVEYRGIVSTHVRCWWPRRHLCP